MTNATNASIPDIEWNFFLHSRLTSAVILGLLSVAGTIGNIHVLIVYSKFKTSKLRHFILVLALNDLIGSAITIPLSIIDIRFPMTMKSSIYCKIIRCLTYNATMTSGLLLAVVAFERYRKVCHPFGTQMTLRQLKISCLVVFCVSLALATPPLFLYDSVPTDVKLHPELNGGKMCGPRETAQTIPYFSGLLIIGTTVVIVETIFYIFIVLSVCEWKKYKAYLMDPERNQNQQTTINDKSNESRPLLSQTRNSKYSRFKNPKLLAEIADDNVTMKEEMDKMDRAVRSAIMFMLAAIFSYAGYIPIILFSIIQAANISVFTVVEEGVGSSLAMLNRLYFLNNLVNPVIYGFMDKTFRQKCKRLYVKCCCSE